MSKIRPDQVFSVLSQYLIKDVLPIVVDLDRSHQNRLVDARTGREYLDCISYVASNPLGFNHPGMFDPEFERSLLRAARSKPSNSDFYTVEMAEFVDVFAAVAKRDLFRHMFFIEGGAMAAENALKAAFDWKVRKNFSKGAKRELGRQVIHFHNAFHGRSGYTMSMTNSSDPRKTMYYPKFDWPRIVSPAILFPLKGDHLERVVQLEQQAELEIRQAIEGNPEDIAAIYLETIQCEGGDNHFRPEFHQLLARLAKEYDLMLIYDEVQTGVGFSGKFWAFENYPVKPDIISFGKKMQVCGVLVGERVDEVENNVFREASRINSTWGGNLVDMVRARRYLELIQEHNLCENASVVGVYFRSKLEELEAKYPEILYNARGLGLICAIDVARAGERSQGQNSPVRDQLHAACLNNGLLLLKASYRTIRFRPSLIFTKPEVDEVISLFEAAVQGVLSK